MPTIAVVTGAAIGAGVNLPLACDIVIAGTSARFDPRFLDVGVHPGGGHLFLLEARVGRQGAAALVAVRRRASPGPRPSGPGWPGAACPTTRPLPFALKLARRATGRDRELMLRAKATLAAAARHPAGGVRPRARRPSSGRWTGRASPTACGPLRDRLQKKEGLTCTPPSSETQQALRDLARDVAADLGRHDDRGAAAGR